MQIEYVEKCSDFDGPVLDIHYATIEEAFEMSKLFKTVTNAGKCVWYGKNRLRIPLINMSKIGTGVI